MVAFIYNTTYFTEEKIISVTLKLSDELIDLAKPHAAAMHRSIPKQIEYWARLGLEEAKAGQAVDYKLGV